MIFLENSEIETLATLYLAKKVPTTISFSLSQTFLLFPPSFFCFVKVPDGTPRMQMCRFFQKKGTKKINHA
jgi:hypothetical protein